MNDTPKIPGQTLRPPPRDPAAANPIANPDRIPTAWPVMLPPMETYALALQFQFDMSQWWPQPQLHQQQLLQAQMLIHHALRTVPFHAARLQSVAGIPPGQLTMARFRELPIMTRRDIQNAGDALITRAMPKSHGTMHVVRSSGSTGRPIEVRGCQLTQMIVMALTMRGHRWHRRNLMGKNVDIRTALPPGTPPATRWAPVPRTGPVTRLDIAQPIATLLEQVIDEDPAYLQSHPSTIKGMVQLSVASGRRPRSLREVRTFGEAIPPDLRDLLHEHWGVPLVDNYSANEVGTIAHQCPTSTNMHVQSESVLVEVLRDDGSPCEPGESGRIVLTALHNFATPLIRYEIGDRVRLGPPCACGRGLPVLEQILGRERNLLVLPNGNRVFPETRVGGLEEVAPMRQFQLIQPAIDRLVFNVVPGRPWTTAEEDHLRTFLRDKYGFPFEIEIVYHDDIPRAANGKFEEFRTEAV